MSQLPPPPPPWNPNPYGSGQPPGYQPYGYPPPGYGYGPSPFESRGTAILVLGILGLVVCGPLGTVAFVMGRNLKAEAEAAGYPEPGNAKAGRICGLIATIILALGLLGLAAAVVAQLAATS